MNPVPPNLPPGKDPQERGEDEGAPWSSEDILVAARTSSEAWHLGRLHALRQMMSSVDDRVVYELLSVAADVAWEGFVDQVSRTEMQREDLLEAGPPDEVWFDEKKGVPLMAWKQRSSEHVDLWGMLKVRPIDAAAAPEIALSTPFRQVQLSKLPEGTVVVPIHDGRHIATAAVNEILETIERDMQRAMQRYDGEEQWRALRSHASFMSEAAKMAMDNLPEDQFRDWRRPELARCRFEDVPERVSALGLTTRSQQGLALHYVTRAYASAQEEADEAEDVPALRAARVVESVRAMIRQVGKVLDGFNATAMVAAQCMRETFQAMVVFNPVPGTIPVLVVVPAAPS